MSQQARDPEDVWCAGISQRGELLVLTPEPIYSAWMGKLSLILSSLAHRIRFSLLLIHSVHMEMNGWRTFFFFFNNIAIFRCH